MCIFKASNLRRVEDRRAGSGMGLGLGGKERKGNGRGRMEWNGWKWNTWQFFYSSKEWISFLSRLPRGSTRIGVEVFSLYFRWLLI